MSNNTPDYENNLAFAPTSADDLNKQGRQVDVLVVALEKCERLEKQLNVAMNALFDIEAMEFERYLTNNGWVGVGQMRKVAKEARKQIKELDNENSN